MARERCAGALRGGRGLHAGARRGHRRRQRAASWSGCSSTRPSTPPAPAPSPSELIEARFPVFESGRGGQMTYHGPGQRVAYVMLDLKRRGPDVRRFVATLEEWIIRTLAAFNVRGERREDRIGVWVRRPDKGEGYEDKIAAIGIRVSAMGDAARHGAQCRSGPRAFFRHRAVRGERAALRRHQPGRSRHSGVDAGGGHGAAAGIRGAVRGNRAIRTAPRTNRRARAV